MRYNGLVITFSKPNATRLALKIAAGSQLAPYMVVYPDGSVGATDGVCMVLSRGAHDADMLEPLYVSPSGSLPVSKGSLSYYLDDSMDEMVEVRVRSESRFPVTVSRDGKAPRLHNALPGHLTPVAAEMPLFDSILGGKIAADYGLKRGVWRKGPWDDRVYLDDVDEGDTVVLAAIRR